jgi:hypothetical protein
MAVTQLDNIGDIVNAGLKDLGRMRVTDLTTDLQEHVALDMFSRGKSMTYDVPDGYGMQFDVLKTVSNNTRANALYDPISLGQVDGLLQGSVPFRHMTGGYIFEEREISANAGASKIIDILKVRRHQHLVNWSETFESMWWGRNYVTDSKAFYGYSYWFPKNATAGFNGDLQTTVGGVTVTTKAGITPSAQAGRWNSYTGNYVNVTKGDAISLMKDAFDLSSFKSPVNSGLGSFDTGTKYQIYTVRSVRKSMEILAENQNENLGTDLDSMHGDVLFRKLPVKWVPYLEADTTNPIIGINWGLMKIGKMKGWWQKEKFMNPMPGFATVNGVVVNSSFNTICTNVRQGGWTLATGITYP